MKNYPNTECSVANTILLSKIDQRRIKRFVQYNQKIENNQHLLLELFYDELIFFKF